MLVRAIETETGQQEKCGLILKTDNSEVIMTFRGYWLIIPLASITEDDGVFTLEAFSVQHNFSDQGNGVEGDWEFSVNGPCLMLLANPLIDETGWRYDSELITFPTGNFYISENGIKVDYKQEVPIIREAEEEVIQCIFAFYGINVSFVETGNQWGSANLKATFPPEFALELRKTGGIKSGQFIL